MKTTSRRTRYPIGFVLLTASLLGAALLPAASADAQEALRRKSTASPTLDPGPRRMLLPASAPQVDGDLDDLITYIRLLQAENGGCALEIEDPDQDVVLSNSFVPCAPLVPISGGNYFVNGFDQTLGLVAFNGQDLLLGIRTAGMIGDPDGDGDPDTDCGTNIVDSPGVGAFESYKWFIDGDCNGNAEILVVLNNNTISVTGIAYDSTSFSFNGTDLEVQVYGVNLVPQFRARTFAGSDVDGLSEDLSAEFECEPLSPTINLTKTVDNVCSGGVTEVTLTVTNTSPVLLDPVDLEDGLPEGFSYVPASVSGLPEGEPNQSDTTLTFPSISLDPGEQRQITFMIQSPEGCAGAHLNRVRAYGAFTHPCNPEPSHVRYAFLETTAMFYCFRTDVSLQDRETCDGFTAQFCPEVTMGEGPFSFAWSGPGNYSSSDSCVTVGAGGIYTVTVTDQNGCSGTASATLTVNPNPTVEIAPREVCDGFTDTLCPLVSSGAGPFQFSWSGPEGFSSADSCITVGAEGTYTVTVTDQNGCTGTGSGTLTVYDNPVVEVGNGETCAGFTDGLCPVVSSGAGPFTFSWSGPEGFASADSCITVGVEGIYAVTVTDRNGCTGTGSGTLTVHPNPTVEIAPREVCDGFTDSLCPVVTGGEGPFQFTWSGPENFASGDSCITVGVDGTYSVTVTDEHGCTGTGSGTLTVHPNPVVEVADGEACDGFTDQLCAAVSSGTGPFEFSWSGPEGFASADSCITVGVDGTYSVTVTDRNGCTGTGSGDLTIHANPVVEVNDGEVCAGATDQLCAQVTGGTGPYTFSWTGPEGFASSDSCITVSVAGTYNVTVIGVHGCQGFGSGELTVHANPVVEVAKGEACEGFTDDLCAEVTGGVGPFTFSWSGPENFASADSCITVGVDGTYHVTVTDIHGCQATGSGTMTVNPPPTVEVADGETCDGFTDELCAVTSGHGPFAFSWTGPEGFSSGDSCVTVGVEGTYMVTVTDRRGCSGTASGTLTVHPNPVVQVADGEACQGLTDDLCAEVTGEAGPYTFAWSGPETFASADSCITVGVGGTYSVTVTDSRGCTGTASGTLEIHPNPTVEVADGGICAGGEAPLCPEVTGAGPYAFSWSGPGGFASTDSCITVSNAGTYTVTVTDRNGCTGSGSGSITVFTPSLQVSAQSDTVCVGETGTVMVKITNTSPGTETFVLQCSLDGQGITEIPVGEVASGQFTLVPIEVTCETADTVLVSCNVIATLAGSPDCMAQAPVNGQVVCRAPAVKLTKIDDVAERACAEDGSKVTYTLVVENIGLVDLTNLVIKDQIEGPIALYAESANPTPAAAPSGGTLTGPIRWEVPGPLAPGAKLTFTYQVILSVDGQCSGDPVYGTVAEVEAYCANAKATATDGEETCISCLETCWMTGGGFLNEEMKSGHKEDNFGGNVGPPPRGSWQHVQRIDNKIQFNFHSHDVHVIRCYHDGGDGPCHPETDDNVIEFGGTGEYNLGSGPRAFAAVWTARVEDHGEPGNNPKRANGGCGSPDYYFIEVREAGTNTVVFTAEGFLDGGNFQLHKDVGTLGADDPSMALEIREVMLQAFPNPVQGLTSSIRYAVPQHLDGAEVDLNVFDVSGRLVRRVLEGKKTTGLYTTSWDLRDDSGGTVAAGVYFYRLRVGKEQRIARLLVIRN